MFAPVSAFHSIGTWLAKETPDALGPRNDGQFWAVAVLARFSDHTATHTRQRMSIIFSSQTDVPHVLAPRTLEGGMLPATSSPVPSQTEL